MHSVNITGDTPEALYFNVVKTLSLFLQGATAPVPSSQAGEAPSEAAVSRTSDAAIATTMPPEGREFTESSTAVTKPKKGAKAKVEKMESDDISDVGGKTIENEPKTLTLEADIIPRLMAIQAAGVKRGLTMPECVKYIQKLYGPFGIANAKQLKPDQFEEFLEASEAYLTGEA